jgi:hypothetical protein
MSSSGFIVDLQSDPRTSPGANADIGTIGLIRGTATIMIKTGRLPGDWSEVGGAGKNLYSDLEYAWNDEWLLGQQLAVGNGWNGSALGGRPYSLTLVGANTAITPVTGTQRMGVVSLDTGTTNAGIASFSTAATLARDSNAFGTISFEWVGGIANQSTAGEAYHVTLGLVGNAPGYGCYFVYDPQNALGGNPTNLQCWQAWTMEAGVPTQVLLPGNLVTDVAFPNTGISRLKVVYNAQAPLVANYYINDVLVASIATTLPTHSLAGSVEIVKTNGVNVRKVYTDYTSFECTLVSPRIP